MHSISIYIVHTYTDARSCQAVVAGPAVASGTEEALLFQRDYILRMIEEMGMILVRLREIILGRASTRVHVEGQIEKALQGIGFDFEVARLADGETLERMVAPTGSVEPARCWLIAEGFYLEGLEAQLDARSGDAAAHFTKALRLYRLVEPDALLPSGFAEAKDRIREIEERLTELNGDGGNSGASSA